MCLVFKSPGFEISYNGENEDYYFPDVTPYSPLQVHQPDFSPRHSLLKQRGIRETRVSLQFPDLFESQ
jgi:hypothetical protein